MTNEKQRQLDKGQKLIMISPLVLQGARNHDFKLPK